MKVILFAQLAWRPTLACVSFALSCPVDFYSTFLREHCGTEQFFVRLIHSEIIGQERKTRLYK